MCQSARPQRERKTANEEKDNRQFESIAPVRSTDLLDGVEQIRKDMQLQRDGLHVELWDPRNDDRVKHLVVGLVDVRAADDIRISYDFERDGWKIEQASTFEWDADDDVCDPDWQEVAFIQAWSREKPCNNQDQTTAQRGAVVADCGGCYAMNSPTNTPND